MKSLTAKFASSRKWALLFILFVGAGLLVAACGDEETPAPTTPTPPPAPPPPPPEPEPPATPTGLTVSATTESSITWTWNAVEGATAYAVQVSMDETFGDDDAIALALTPTHTVSDLPPSTSVYLRVAAAVGTSLEDALLSDWSTHSTGMTARPPPPAAPANLRVTGRGHDYIEWTWDEVPEVDGYRVQYSLDDEQFTAQDASEDLPATQHSYRVGNLAVDTDVYLRVQSFVGTGADRLESAWSTHVTGMTEPPPPMAPDTPTGLMVSETGDNFIQWTWNAVSDADGYEIQFSEDSQFTDDDPSQDIGNNLTYRRSGLGYDARGYLRVRAYTGSGADRLTSEWSGAATGLTSQPPPDPAVPAGLSATGGDGMVTWTWRAVQDVDGYQIQYSDNEAFTSSDPTEDLTAEDLSYTRENLEPDTTHYLRVRSFVVVNETRFESDWAGPVSGRTDLAKLAVPTGLAVDSDATDHDSIGWTWDAVAGVDGYEAQFSTSQPFEDTDQIFTNSGEDNTSVAVHRLAAEADGYLRVRSVVGTGTSARRSDWSGASKGTTTVAPAPDPLAAPTNFESTASTTTSITLEWDAVNNAGSYEVQQQVAGGSWGDATCNGGGNEVDEEECVASGLESGTDYNFRVRAIPEDDTTHGVSAWTETDEAIRTDGPSPTRPSMGAGDLNITWRSTTTAITWRWDQSADRDYQTKVLGTNQILDPANPCDDRNVAWADTQSFDTSHKIDSSTTPTATGAHLLCVRGTYRDSAGKRQYDAPSWVWGAVAPPVPSLPTANDDAEAFRTESLSWTLTNGASGNGNIDYEFRFVTDRAATTDDDPEMMDEATCQAQAQVEVLTPPGSITTYTTNTNLALYTNYRLCYRAQNASGRSDWSHAALSETPAVTLPAAVRVSRKSYVVQTGTTDIVWRLNIVAGDNVPRASTNYKAKTITYPISFEDTTTSPARTVRTVAPTVKACTIAASSDQGDQEQWTIASANVTTDSDNAFVIEHSPDRPGSTAVDQRVHLCVQPTIDARLGPWTLSSVEANPNQ